MKNKKNSMATNGPVSQPAESEEVKNELSEQLDAPVKIPVKPYEKPSRAYFSSPCYLSEFEDNEDV